MSPTQKNIVTPQQVDSITGATGQTIRVVAALSIVAIVASVVAIFLTLTRGGAGSSADTTACRTVAWNALPDPARLPSGWTMSTSNFYVDGAGASITGPVPSDGTSPSPTIYLQVTCFGGDGHLVMTRFHDSANAAGGTDVAFTKLGDESFASQDSQAQGTSIYIRRGSLVASIVAPIAVAIAEVEQTASVVDSGLSFALSGGTVAAVPGNTPAGSIGPAGSGRASGVPSVGPSDVASDQPSAQPTAVHDVPDLEALLPKKIAGVTLTYQSTTGTGALAGDDPSSAALVASLAQMGKKPADLQIAEAYDEGSLDANVIAFRVHGIAADKLGQAIIDSWLSGGASGITTANVTISGKTVTKVTYSDGGASDYLYFKNEVVYDLSTSTDSVATETIALFP
ncbi:MAG TPA: hypothetical protein VK656_05855 [Candidatus Acidoferrum sp.]|nr:hypothetical protein [Candidatus Acidoferrum sp.]